MAWNKPKNAGYWLLLLSPGAVSLAFTAFGKVALSPDNEITPSILGLPVAFIMCPVIAYFLVRGHDGKGAGLGIALTFVLLIVNFAIAFGGCAVMNPKLDLK